MALLNHVLETIQKRRSIRKYIEQPVAKETINQLLLAAMYAPSAANQQPWHFIVVEKRELLEELSTFNSGYSPVAMAQAAIIVCGEEGLAKLKQYWVQDCSAATENILIAATAIGLGSIWMGVSPGSNHIEKIRELFNIPDKITPFSVVSIGYPAEEKTAENRFKAERIQYNSWK